MLAIQHRSLSEHKAKLEKQRLATLRTQSKREDLIKHTVGVVLLIAVLAAIYHYGL
jgi:hypothetical protein